MACKFGCDEVDCAFWSNKCSDTFCQGQEDTREDTREDNYDGPDY
jgi:hypothetical protein